MGLRYNPCWPLRTTLTSISIQSCKDRSCNVRKGHPFPKTYIFFKAFQSICDTERCTETNNSIILWATPIIFCFIAKVFQGVFNYDYGVFSKTTTSCFLGHNLFSSSSEICLSVVGRTVGAE